MNKYFDPLLKPASVERIFLAEVLELNTAAKRCRVQIVSSSITKWASYQDESLEEGSSVVIGQTFVGSFVVLGKAKSDIPESGTLTEL